MNAPMSTVQARTGKPRKIVQHRPRVADNTLPEFTPSIGRRYLGVEGAPLRTMSQLQSIGITNAYANHRHMMAMRKVNDLEARPAFMLVPNLGPSVNTAKALHFMQPMGKQAKTRHNMGNVDYAQRPLWTGFDERRLT